MKIETFKPNTIKTRSSTASSLMQIKPGTALRISTAADWRRIAGSIVRIGRLKNVTFGTTNDGDDVLVYIKDGQKSTKP